MSSILIADDEANVRRMLGRLLETEGHEVREAAHGAAAVQAVEAAEPDLVVMDLAMPEMDGMAALKALRATRPELPVVMMSGRATLADAVEATRLGAFHFMEKPLSPETVLVTIRRALELRRARELTRELTEELGAGQRLVGETEAMRRVRDVIRQVAPTDARVLVTGESGTGKELVAAALHRLSRRADGPFVRVNSAAIPRELVESEMFGHEKGAFSGATERRRGRFVLADGGTLFLDEIADLGEGAQAKLLRAIEAGEIEPVGGQRSVRVDVRVVAATNRDLRSAVENGSFREDLFYRLNVVPVHLPPLRERLDDLPALVDHLRERMQLRQGLRLGRVTADALERMQGYGWPGNVRELANLCERMAILAPDTTIDESDIALLLPSGTRVTEEGTLSERLEALEKDLIGRAVADARGNIAEAARALGTDRANLYRRMRRLGMDR